MARILCEIGEPRTHQVDSGMQGEWSMRPSRLIVIIFPDDFADYDCAKLNVTGPHLKCSPAYVSIRARYHEERFNCNE